MVGGHDYDCNRMCRTLVVNYMDLVLPRFFSSCEDFWLTKGSDGFFKPFDPFSIQFTPQLQPHAHELSLSSVETLRGSACPCLFQSAWVMPGGTADRGRDQSL